MYDRQVLLSLLDGLLLDKCRNKNKMGLINEIIFSIFVSLLTAISLPTWYYSVKITIWAKRLLIFILYNSFTDIFLFSFLNQ